LFYNAIKQLIARICSVSRALPIYAETKLFSSFYLIKATLPIIFSGNLYTESVFHGHHGYLPYCDICL